MKYSYTTDRMVCSSRIDVEIVDGILVSANIIDGSNEACRIYVPAASLELYMNDSMWSTYAEILEAL
jgi:hypothetical protein